MATHSFYQQQQLNAWIQLTYNANTPASLPDDHLSDTDTIPSLRPEDSGLYGATCEQHRLELRIENYKRLQRKRKREPSPEPENCLSKSTASSWSTGRRSNETPSEIGAARPCREARKILKKPFRQLRKVECLLKEERSEWDEEKRIADDEKRRLAKRRRISNWVDDVGYSTALSVQQKVQNIVHFARGH